MQCPKGISWSIQKDLKGTQTWRDDTACLSACSSSSKFKSGSWRSKTNGQPTLGKHWPTLAKIPNTASTFWYFHILSVRTSWLLVYTSTWARLKHPWLLTCRNIAPLKRIQRTKNKTYKKTGKATQARQHLGTPKLPPSARLSKVLAATCSYCHPNKTPSAFSPNSTKEALCYGILRTVTVVQSN